MPYIGIDFGTSNSVVANFQYGQAEVVPNHEGLKWTPSIVTPGYDGPGVGQAKENFDEFAAPFAPSRILGTPEPRPSRLAKISAPNRSPSCSLAC